MTDVNNLSEAMLQIESELIKRKANIVKKETVIADYANSFPVRHGRIWVEHEGKREVYQVKYAKTGYRLKPTENLSPGARELDVKLRFALVAFGQGHDTLNGLNEDVILDLLSLAEGGIHAYFVTVMRDGAIRVSSILEFYLFAMRYDTFFKFPRSNVPVCEVPVGWMKHWTDIKSAPPALAEMELR